MFFGYILVNKTSFCSSLFIHLFNTYISLWEMNETWETSTNLEGRTYLYIEPRDKVNSVKNMKEEPAQFWADDFQFVEVKMKADFSGRDSSFAGS